MLSRDFQPGKVDMPDKTPRRNQAESAPSGFGGWTCQSKPPEEEMMLNVAWPGLEGGHARAKPREEEMMPKVAWPGLEGGHARANPREEEIRLKVVWPGLEVDKPGQTPGKKKSGWKCLVGDWRWTCQTKPPGRRNQARSASSGFGGGHIRANPREEEMRLKVVWRGLEVDMLLQTPRKKKSG